MQVPPMPLEVANALAMLLYAGSRPAEGLAILLCFAGMLRISEALALLWDDVVATSRGLIIRIRCAKTGENQETVIANASTSMFVGLARPSGKMSGQTRICDTSYTAFRFWFNAGLRALRMEALGFKSHSLRRGGATARILAGYTLVQVMLEGRWSCESSCRLYLKTAEVAVVNIKRGMDEENLELCRLLGESWEFVARKCIPLACEG